MILTGLTAGVQDHEGSTVNVTLSNTFLPKDTDGRLQTEELQVFDSHNRDGYWYRLLKSILPAPTTAPAPPRAGTGGEDHARNVNAVVFGPASNAMKGRKGDRVRRVTGKNENCSKDEDCNSKKCGYFIETEPTKCCPRNTKKITFNDEDCNSKKCGYFIETEHTKCCKNNRPKAYKNDDGKVMCQRLDEGDDCSEYKQCKGNSLYCNSLKKCEKISTTTGTITRQSTTAGTTTTTTTV
eukprot:gene26261-22734_t